MAEAERVFEAIDYRRRFPALDGVRALAVSMVFAFHYGGGAHGGRVLRVLNALRLEGWAGVDVFFVLSGFLITGILYDTRQDRHFFSSFYARRCLRIFPVYYLVAVVLMLLTPVFRYGWRGAQALFLVYLGNIPAGFDPGLYQVHAQTPAADVYLGHLWSLCVEEQFYLVWPVLVWAIAGRVRLLWTAAGLSALALMLRVWMVLASGVLGSGIDLRGGWLLKMLPFHMDTLLIGAVLALVLRGDRAEQRQRGCKWMLLGAAGVLGGLFGLAQGSESLWMPTLGFALIAVASAGLIGWVLAPGSAAYRIFSLRPLRILGRYSYGFYVYHLLFAAGWAALDRKMEGWLRSAAMARAAVMLVSFVVTFLMAKASYELFEVRFLRWKKRFAYESEREEAA